MVVRNESVRLTLLDEFSTPMAKVAATTIAANRALRDLDGTSTHTAPALSRVSAEANQVDRSLSSAAVSTRRAGSDIDQYSGRLSLLAQALTAIGPAAVPIAAVAVPAVTALSGALGAMVLGAGSAMLAFQGVGDALKALDKAQLDPTADNIARARQEMEALSPVAQKFVMELDRAEPALKKLSQSAARGMFPGLTSGIRDSLTVLPQVRGLVEAVGGAVGNLGEMTGESLASGKWNGFLEFLKAEAPPAIEALGHTVGNLAGGLSELWMAFAPLNNDVNGWLVSASQSFEDWAAGLSRTEGFREFVEYLRTAGPQVQEAVVAIANAGLQIGEAFAPLGGPTLQILTTVADLVATIADSPLGTPLAAIASAVATLSLLNKGLASAQGLTGGLLSGDGGGDAAGGIGSFFQDNADQVKAAASDMRSSFTGVGNTLRQSLGRGLAPTSGQMMTLRGRMREVGAASRQMAGAVGRAGTPMLAMAAMSTGAADKIGLSNTAMLTMAGSMMGPWGTAIGAGVGGLLDLKAAGDEATSAITGLSDVVAAGDVASLSQQLAKAKSEMADLDNVDYGSAKDIFGDLGARMSMNLHGGPEALEKQIKAGEAAQDAMKQLAAAIGGPSESLESVAATAQPAMNALGISLQDLADATPTQLTGLVSQISNYQASADTAAGRTGALSDAMGGLDDSMVSVEDRAKNVKERLDALLGPGLSLSAATDQWRAGLRNLNKELAENGRSLTAQTDAGDKNRSAIRGTVTDLMDLVNAQNLVDPSGKKAAQTLRDGRNAILEAGAAANLSKGELKKYLTTMGLTPETVKTLFNAEVGGAMTNLRVLEAKANGFHDKSFAVRALTDAAKSALASIEAYRIHDKSFTVTQHTNATLGEAKVKKAAGGPIFGAGTSTSDSIPIMASHGEYMIRAAAVEHYGLGFFDAANAKRLATGGPVEDGTDGETPAGKARTAKQAAAARKKSASQARARSKARNAYGDLDVDTKINGDGVSEALSKFADDIDHVRDLYKDAGLQFTKAQKKQADKLRESAKEFDGLTTALKSTKDAQASYQQQVAGSIDHDIFGNGLAGAQAQADADANDNNAMLTALAQAVAQGLDGPLLQALGASGDLTTAQQLAAGGPAAIANLEASYGNKINAQQALGNYAGQQVYGAQITAQTAEVVKQTAAINRMERQLAKIPDAVRDGAAQGSHSGTSTGTAIKDQSANTSTTQGTRLVNRGGGHRRGHGGKNR